ncbi:MAG: ABC transporter permease [Paracoccus denitrificans]|uniref:ABC transporter permease n=1 Tax=Paracoccus denitrificans TaxID=266 RepID=A0A533I9Y0_PARDE|nr:MAG: ABC transporter permease [Paracoccus denitrificans]
MKRLDLHVLGPLIALIVLFIFGASQNSAFLAPANLSNVLARSAFIGLIAVGMTFVITQGGLDLSVGSMAAFLAGISIMTMNALVPSIGENWGTIILGMGAALLGGVLAGCVNGLLITKARIEPFIVTLGTMGIFRSLVTWLADGGTLSLDSGLRAIYRPVYFGGIGWITWPIITLVVVTILGELAMRHTRFGRHVEAIGSNDRVARYSAIDVQRVRLLTYVLLGALVGLATILYVPRLGSASGSTGVLWELEAIAAVIIGGTALKGGRGRVWGTVVGVLILSMIDNILNLTDLVSPYLNGAIQGVIIVLAVVLQREKRAAE